MTARLTTPEVLALARYSRPTLARRIAAGVMPKPIDRGADGGIYDRDAVLKALGIDQPAAPTPIDRTITADAFREARARHLRRAQETGRRHAPRAVPGSASAPA